jgi:uncharacterized lipoprotein YmbA
VIDGTENIWLFWVGQFRSRDEILYTNFDGFEWGEPSSLNQNPDVPHITPSISLDYNGLPHVAWSAYDGDDYELYYSYWDGYRWILEKRITSNQNIADTFPSISFLLDSIPVVAWSRYINGKREVSLSYKIGEEWSPELNISGDKSITRPPKLICFGERIGITWQEKDEIKTALVHFQDLRGIFFLNKTNTTFTSIRVSDISKIQALDKDKYIGFGDSITKGSGDYEGAPKTIFLMEGTNDLDHDISMDAVAFNMQQMAQTCLDFGMTVFLASIIKRDLWEERKEKILDLNEKIEAVASALNINFVDMFEPFWIYQDIPGGIYSDATHPNEQGYQLMAETWYEALVNSMPSIEIDPTSLSFEAEQGGSNPSPQTFRVRNSGAGTLNYQISADQGWISVSPMSGSSTGGWDEIEVSINISNLSQSTMFALSQSDYQGEVTISSEDASNSPQTLTIQLTISSPTIELDKTSLSFEGIQGDPNPSPQTFRIRNSGVQALNYQISADQEWISVSPTSGSSTGEWDEIEVSINISNLSQGSYEGNVTVSAENASNSPQTLTIQLTVFSSTIELDKTSLSFEGTKGEANPSPQTFRIRNSGPGTLNYQISTDKDWISVSPLSGSSTGEWDEIEVSIDISNLSQGTHQGNVTVSAENASNSPQTLTIQLTVLSPTIALDKTSLSFEGILGEANPSPQRFRIRNSGLGTLNYQISTDKGWISVSPTSGSSTGEWDEIEISIDISNLSQGTYQGIATISAENASNSPQRLTINLTVELPALFPPSNFHGEKKKNRSLSQLEYINVLNWEANPENKFIEKYKIYLIEGENKTLLKETDAQTFEYRHRKVEKDKAYKYGLTARDEFGRESEIVTIEIR